MHHTWINTVPTPKPDETHGGPVFISVGQVIELDVSRSASRRLSNAQQDEIEPTTNTAALSVGNAHTLPSQNNTNLGIAPLTETNASFGSPQQGNTTQKVVQSKNGGTTVVTKTVTTSSSSESSDEGEEQDGDDFNPEFHFKVQHGGSVGGTSSPSESEKEDKSSSSRTTSSRSSSTNYQASLNLGGSSGSSGTHEEVSQPSGSTVDFDPLDDVHTSVTFKGAKISGSTSSEGDGDFDIDPEFDASVDIGGRRPANRTHTKTTTSSVSGTAAGHGSSS